MTEQLTDEQINEQVAGAMGWGRIVPPSPTAKWCDKINDYGDPLTDPRAWAAVLDEVDSRGDWDWDLCSDGGEYHDEPRRFHFGITGRGFCADCGEPQPTISRAICLAFLAADQAEKETSDE
jgi:hypothetical protein